MFEYLKRRIACRLKTILFLFLIGEVAQHQCLIFHKDLEKATLTIQCSIQGFPVYDHVQYMLYCLLEQSSKKEENTVITVSFSLEKKVLLFEGLVGPLIRYVITF